MTANPLDREVVQTVVAPRTVGFYRLGIVDNGSFERCYIGRSDTSLRRRLVEHATTGKYTHFQAEPTETIHEAFLQECGAWHRANGELDNKLHPDAPNYLQYTCPYCEFRTILRESSPRREVIQ